MDNLHNISDDLDGEAMKSFEKYDCEVDDNVIYESMQEECTNPVRKIANKVLMDRAKYNNSYVAASSY